MDLVKFMVFIFVAQWPDWPRIAPYHKVITSLRARLIGSMRGNSVGPQCQIGRNFQVSRHCKIKLGRRVRIKENVQVTGALLQVGDKCIISEGTEIDASSSVTIGKDSFISKNCEIYSHIHHYDKKETPIFRSPETLHPTVIGENVLLYPSVVITAGVKVGDGAVIGNKSIVTKDLESYGIFFGIPARKVQERV